MKFFSFLQQYFSIILILGGISGLFFPQFFQWGESLAQYLLMISLFLGFLRLDFLELKKIHTEFFQMLGIILVSMIGLPLLGYAISLPFSTEIQIATVLLMGVSGGMASPLIASFFNLRIVWTFLFVSLTSFIVSLSLPFFIFLLFGINIDISFLEMVLFLGKIIFIPLLFSFLLKHFFPKIVIFLLPISGGLGSINMFFFVGFLIAPSSLFILELIKTDTFHFIFLVLWVCVLFLLRYIIGFFLPAKSQKERWTNSFMFGVMNNGLVILLAAQFFSDYILLLMVLTEIPWILAVPIFEKILHKYRNF